MFTLNNNNNIEAFRPTLPAPRLVEEGPKMDALSKEKRGRVLDLAKEWVLAHGREYQWGEGGDLWVDPYTVTDGRLPRELAAALPTLSRGLTDPLDWARVLTKEERERGAKLTVQEAPDGDYLVSIRRDAFLESEEDVARWLIMLAKEQQLLKRLFPYATWRRLLYTRTRKPDVHEVRVTARFTRDNLIKAVFMTHGELAVLAQPSWYNKIYKLKVYRNWEIKKNN